DLRRPEVVRRAVPALLLETLLAPDALEGLAHVGRSRVPILEVRIKDALEAHDAPQCSAATACRVYWFCEHVNAQRPIWQYLGRGNPAISRPCLLRSDRNFTALPFEIGP